MKSKKMKIGFVVLLFLLLLSSLNGLIITTEARRRTPRIEEPAWDSHQRQERKWKLADEKRKKKEELIERRRGRKEKKKLIIEEGEIDAVALGNRLNKMESSIRTFAFRLSIAEREIRELQKLYIEQPQKIQDVNQPIKLGKEKK